MTIGVGLSGTAPVSGQGDDPATQTGATGAAVTGVSTGSTPAPTATGTETAPWYSTAVKDPGLQEFAKSKGWADNDAALKSYKELETAFSAKSKSAAPADPKEYEFGDVKLKDGMQYNKEFADAFKGMAHKAGLSKEQAAALHAEYVGYAGSQFETQMQTSNQQLTERLTKTAADLEGAFKAKIGTPVFDRQVEMAKRAIRLLDPALADELRSIGVIAKVGTEDKVMNATVFKALAEVGNKMFAEDSIHGRPADAVNPFDPKTTDLNAQGWLVKNDPEKAKLLIRSLPADAQRMWSQFLAK